MHCARGQRGDRHHSLVGGVLEISHPCLVSVLLTGPFLLELKFFSETFSPSRTLKIVHIHRLHYLAADDYLQDSRDRGSGERFSNRRGSLRGSGIRAEV